MLDKFQKKDETISQLLSTIEKKDDEITTLKDEKSFL